MPPKSTDPKHVDISLSKGIQIVWSDAHQSSYSLDLLRNNCPCASCRHTPAEPATPAPAKSNPFQMYKPATKLLSAQAVGRYAVQLHWGDGHNTGIYSFDHLRSLCPCPQCEAERRA